MNTNDDDVDIETIEHFFKESEEILSLIPQLNSDENTKRAEDIVCNYINLN